MLVYDVTKQPTFDNVKKWLINIEQVCRLALQCIVHNVCSYGISLKHVAQFTKV